MDQLVRFARWPTQENFAAVPFDDQVWLGLGRRLVAQPPSKVLADPRGWILPARGFRGHVGPFSALELLAGEDSRFGFEQPSVGTLELNVGPHLHCASPPVPPPTRLEHLRRLSVQPTGGDTCITWWTVDVYVDPTGKVAGVTLDLWEP